MPDYFAYPLRGVKRAIVAPAVLHSKGLLQSMQPHVHQVIGHFEKQQGTSNTPQFGLA